MAASEINNQSTGTPVEFIPIPGDDIFRKKPVRGVIIHGRPFSSFVQIEGSDPGKTLPILVPNGLLRKRLE